jgi:hypothetical protein
MIFHRSIPPRTYSDYTTYRPFLRRDFRNRCAYCLRHEYHLGGEANCNIDHHRPVKGPYGRPDLINVYSNLYWSCAECNQNKGDIWPDPEEEAGGFRFIDPCNPEDDHDLHLQVHTDGTMEPLTPAGQYTFDNLKLWCDQLTFFRARCYRLQLFIADKRALLSTKTVSPEIREALESALAEAEEFINPPVFDRPRG